MMENINKLVSLCNADVSIRINAHKGSSQSIEEYIADLELLLDEEIIDRDSEIFKAIIAKNILIELDCYPDTSNGAYSVYGTDLNKMVLIAIHAIEDSRL